MTNIIGCVGGGSGGEGSDGGRERVSGGPDGLCGVVDLCGGINQHQHPLPSDSVAICIGQ